MLINNEELSDLRTVEDAVEVPVSYKGTEYICPSCEKAIPTRKQINMSKPPKYASQLNDIIKCCFCSFVFSYSTRAVVLRK